MANLETLFPSDAWQRDMIGVPTGIVMFRYKQSDLRIVMIPGLYPGTTEICGSYLLFRAGDDSMNMECSVDNSVETTKCMIRTAVALSGHARLSHDKFLANFARWITEKTFRILSSEAPADVTAAARAPSEPSTPQKRENSDAGNVAQKASRREPSPEPENTCCICLVAPADTTALPCGCSVVCSVCSRALNKDRLNAGLCVVCRQQMTHVSYPDNSMKPTNSTH